MSLMYNKPFVTFFMPAENFRHQPQPVIHLPTPREGFFKAQEVVSHDLTIPQGEVTVSKRIKNGWRRTFVEVTPQMDKETLDLLNRRIGLEETLSDKFEMRSELLMSLPRVRVAVDGGVNFIFEGEVVGGVSKDEGFWVRKEKDQEEQEGKPSKFMVYKTTTPETSRDGWKFALEIFRKQQTGIPGKDGAMMLVLTHITFECAEGGFFELNDLIKEWMANGHSPEELSSIIKVKLRIEDRGNMKSGEDGDGQSTAAISPMTDDGGGKLNL